MEEKDLTPTAIDKLADRYVKDLAQADPTLATAWGFEGCDNRLPDYSPQGLEKVAEIHRTMLLELDKLPLQSEADQISAASLKDRGALSLEIEEIGEGLRKLNVIDSPFQQIRDVFALMDISDEAGAQNLIERLDAIPQALSGHIESLRLAAQRGHISASRQIGAVAKQAREAAQMGGAFDVVAQGVIQDEKFSVQLAQALDNTRQSCAQFATFLTDELAPQASDEDAVGFERYEVFSREFVGAKVDLFEAYEWGQDQLAQIEAEQKICAEKLYGPGTQIREAMEKLNRDPDLMLHGADQLRQWMQETADGAIAALNGTHFAIPEEILEVECCIDGAGTGGIYYTGPAADFSRPGRIWWSVPPGEEEFATWQELTTVYHEGVPGHHLQVGIATAQRGMNLWRRLACWNSGHGEGWALYAEKLMAELGFLDEPGVRLGMLDAQRLRAARVVLDIGLHLGLKTPEGSSWDAPYAWDFLNRHIMMSEGFLRFEFDRYLGWPGQAPSYKLGQRLWEQLRADYLATARSRGEDATLKAFHAKALPLGSLPMDVLAKAVLS